jgi:aspartate kinase
MSIIVQKFGGTSVATADKILRAARRAVDAKKAGNQVVMVVSARGQKTDELIELANEIAETNSTREMDVLLSTGEQETIALTAMAIHSLGEKAISLTGMQMGMLTDASHSKARITRINTDRLRKLLAEGNIIVAAGFQGYDEHGDITTLGRGGSDTTATALAAALGAQMCEIYTDVDGIYTTDPRLVPQAQKLEAIAYDEMLELTSMGGGKMHSRSIEFAKKFRVPLCVRSATHDEPGTLISDETPYDIPVVSVALVKTEVRVTLSSVPDVPGVMSTIFAAMAARRIPLDLVVQDVGQDGRAEISFTVPQDELADTLTAADEAIEKIGAGKVTHGTNVSKVSAVGTGMQSHAGVAAEMFAQLAERGINIKMISTGDIKISVLVDRDQNADAVRAVHEGFKLHQLSNHIRRDKAKGPSHLDDLSQAEREREVVKKLAGMEDIVVSDVHVDKGQARVSLHNIPDSPGIAAKIFSEIAKAGIMVDLIVQNVSQENKTSITLTVLTSDAERCVQAVEKLKHTWPQLEIWTDDDIVKISVKGIGLRSHTGVGEKMFRALAEVGVNIQMVATSEIRMSVVIAKKDAEKAQMALLKTFELS